MTKLKTFKISEIVTRIGDGDHTVLGYIEAKNIQSAVKKAFKEYLTKEQIKKALMQENDKDLKSYIYESKYFDFDGNELENVKEYNEDTMNYEDYELVIEQQNNNEDIDQ